MEKFWLVWEETSGSPTYKHDSEESARTEAERLARRNPGKVFNVFEMVDSCRKNDITWASQLQNDDVPF